MIRYTRHGGHRSDNECTMELMRYEDETCRCPVGYYGDGEQCCQHVIQDCTEGEMHDTLNGRQNVITFIKPLSYSGDPFEVVCSFTWGGATIIHKRRDIYDATDFNKKWIEYRDGFGTVHGNFWLGLEKMYQILQNSAVGFILHFHLLNESLSRCMWFVGKFDLEGESSNYTATFQRTYLSRDDWCDGMFPSLTQYSRPFSTFDHISYPDNFNCTGREESGWWFADDVDCSFSNLNSKRIDDEIVINTNNGTIKLSKVHMQLIRI
ncbi:hypothetical protein LOTGIDRAFT_236034 [Lottia gigantea]|uniref:Fibrinogen C-terminal domain-containing protein n=1 Tax=Lottia gigantea TaxID=225164 RepID=V3ZR31_LOTGI|nr:hypothetical protein LOTGIDRAFT_236034 [Lottia gigantea]ESO85000.1 hypothetical protein LOTGIDRAFT_236034 [Lottia gigantea]